MRSIAQVCILGTWILTATAAFAGIGTPQVEAHSTDPIPMSIFCLPDGTGRSLTEAFLFSGGGYADASIIVQILDGQDIPIYAFPAEDIWLRGTAGGLAGCGTGARPDHNTDLEGRTIWSLPLRAGGSVDPDAGEQLLIMVNGLPYDVALENLRINSADINGDGRVNLSDAGFFDLDLGGSAYRSDFNWDGVVNLPDAGMMASALGAACP